MISPTLASTYRKELATGKTTRYVGKGLPREERDLTEEDKTSRQTKLAEYDAHVKRSNRGKWGQKLTTVAKTTAAIKADTTAIKADTKAIRDDTTAIRNFVEGGEVPRKEGQRSS